MPRTRLWCRRCPRTRYRATDVAAIGYGVAKHDALAGILAGLTLAMAILPNEFPVVVTMFLALGAWRLSRRRVLARRIPAVAPSVGPMSAVTSGLCIAAALVLAPLWAPLLLAAWFADLLRPAVRKLERVLGGRRRAAGALVVLVVVGVLLPLVGIALALATAMQDLLVQVRAAIEGQGSLASALLGGSGAGSRPEVRDWADLASRYGANAWRTLSVVARASASAAIATLVFVVALYTFVVDGDRAYAWLEKHVPVNCEELTRLAGAFRETGRGLLVAGGGTALVQGGSRTLLSGSRER